MPVQIMARLETERGELVLTQMVAAEELPAQIIVGARCFYLHRTEPRPVYRETDLERTERA